jgi:hypothetical protein
MHKRYIGTSSASLASGRVVFPGDYHDFDKGELAENEHLADMFIDGEPPAPEAEAEPEPEASDEPEAPAPAAKSKSNK